MLELTMLIEMLSFFATARSALFCSVSRSFFGDHPAVLISEEPRVTFVIDVAIVAHRPGSDRSVAGVGGQRAEVDLLHRFGNV